MIKVIIQPELALSPHGIFANTIARPVSLELIRKYATSKDMAILTEAYPGGTAPTWVAA